MCNITTHLKDGEITSLNRIGKTLSREGTTKASTSNTNNNNDNRIVLVKASKNCLKDSASQDGMDFFCRSFPETLTDMGACATAPLKELAVCVPTVGDEEPGTIKGFVTDVGDFLVLRRYTCAVCHSEIPWTEDQEADVYDENENQKAHFHPKCLTALMNEVEREKKWLAKVNEKRQKALDLEKRLEAEEAKEQERSFMIIRSMYDHEAVEEPPVTQEKQENEKEPHTAIEATSFIEEKPAVQQPQVIEQADSAEVGAGTEPEVIRISSLPLKKKGRLGIFRFLKRGKKESRAA